MRLLVVEDELALLDQLRDFLSSHGYAVDTASDGEQGCYLANEYDYDGAIIDLGLPKMNGIHLIQALRNKQINFPILILTARGAWQDKVEGLEAGADDYLVKPFHNEELRARLQALLRRASGHASSLLEFGPLSIDLSKKKVVIDGATPDLTQFEYNVLEYLIHHRNKVISKTELTDHLYEQDFDKDSNVIEVFVGRLRKKLDPNNRHQLISTVRGHGYRFTLGD